MPLCYHVIFWPVIYGLVPSFQLVVDHLVVKITIHILVTFVTVSPVKKTVSDFVWIFTGQNIFLNRENLG